MAAGRPCPYGCSMFGALLRPWHAARTWRELAHVCTDLAVGTVTFSVIVTLLATSVGLAVIVPVGAVLVWLLFAVAQTLGRIERSRLAALLDLDLTARPHPPLQAAGWWRRLLERLRSASRWREIAYLLVLLPLGCITFAVTAAVWSAGLALVALPAYVAALPDGVARFG